MCCNLVDTCFSVANEPVFRVEPLRAAQRFHAKNNVHLVRSLQENNGNGARRAFLIVLVVGVESNQLRPEMLAFFQRCFPGFNL
jgi:hypothetical protein